MESFALKGVLCVVFEMEEFCTNSLVKLKASFHNCCPAFSLVMKKNCCNWMSFIEKMPVFEVTSEQILLRKLPSLSDQLALLVLADVIRDVNQIDEIERNVRHVASPQLLNYLDQVGGSVGAFVKTRSDVFQLVGNAVYETNRILAPLLELELRHCLSKGSDVFLSFHLHVFSSTFFSSSRTSFGRSDSVFGMQRSSHYGKEVAGCVWVRFFGSTFEDGGVQHV